MTRQLQSSLRPPHAEHGFGGLQDDLDVQERVAVLQIVEVVFQFLFSVLDPRGVAVVDLGPAGDAGAEPVAVGVEGDLFFELGGEFGLFGSRPDDAHLAPEDVPELGDLVKAELAENGPDGGYEVCVIVGEGGFSVFAVFHGAELVHGEGVAAQPRAGLTEEHREAGVDDDGRNYDGGHDRPEDKPGNGHQEVEDSLPRVGEGHLEDHVVVVAEGMGNYQGDPPQGVFRELRHVLQEASVGKKPVGPILYLRLGIDVGVAHQDRAGGDRGLFE